MRVWFAAGLALVFFALAFFFSADSETKPLRKRFAPEWIDVAQDWNDPSLQEGRTGVIENRVLMPRLIVPITASDTYRLRIFYILKGDKPAKVRFAGVELGELAPSRKWSRAILSTPIVLHGEKPELSFRMVENGKLLLRRVDYRNYFFRIGSFILVKPKGGSREPVHQAWFLGTLLSLMTIALLGAISNRKIGSWKVSIIRVSFAVGLLAAGMVVVPRLLGVSLHSHPAFLAVVFLGICALSGLRREKVDWRRGVAIGAISIISVLFAMALAEGLLRIWNPPISRPRIGSYAKYSPNFGWVNRLNVRGWQVDIGYHIRINSHGHRGPEYSLQKPEGVFRILGLGDSFTFGWGVEENQTFLKVMERRLLEAGHRVEVINAAVPAWHSIQSLNYLTKEGIRFHPDLIVMSFFVDDVIEARIERFQKSRKATNLRKEEAELHSKKKSLATWFRLYNVWFNYQKIRRAAKEHLRRNPYPDFDSERKVLPKDFEKDRESVESLKRVVSEWAAVREKIGLPMVFTFIPPGGALNAPAYQGNARELKRVSGEKGFPYLDVISIFERHSDPQKLYLHPKDGHMSAVGHAEVGKALAEMILKGGWIRR